MAFFPDLSPYCYHRSDIRPNTLNVGWLEINEAFPKGNASDAFIKTLWRFCKVPVVQTRGFHVCEFCNMRRDAVPLIELDGEKLKSGSSEIRVLAKNGVIYAAPHLVFHYVKDHGYQPPQEFIDAVLSGPEPESEDYRAQLEALRLSK